MATAILTQPAPSVDLSELVLTYLQKQQEAAPSMAFVEAMCVELAQIERITGDSEFGECELRYAYKIAADEPVGFDDLPPCLWP
jgi:hypothetical protein